MMTLAPPLMPGFAPPRPPPRPPPPRGAPRPPPLPPPLGAPAMRGYVSILALTLSTDSVDSLEVMAYLFHRQSRRRDHHHRNHLFRRL